MTPDQKAVLKSIAVFVSVKAIVYTAIYYAAKKARALS